MGTVTDLRTRRQAKGPSGPGSRFVTCAHCGERHPIVRLADGTVRCLTAFVDRDHWFCRNRGCRAAWLAKQSSDG
ncbi:MAG TPA: hypothetical protein VL403_07005 [Candidatus Kryptonia bacterium]|nr:hypothetical protein [Candidatus Kryptonia bacterium]